jgi:lipopolysaccharide transport system permease protein
LTLPAAAASSCPPDAPPADPVPCDVPVLIIKPTPGWRSINLRELWQFRELLWFLAWRDIQVRYKHTVLGAAWAIFQPLTSMLVFTLFFGILVGLGRQTGDIPYPVFSYAGLLPWTYFAGALGGASNSVLASGGLISKVYFPRLLIPASAILAGLVDFAIALVALFGLMLYYGIVPSLSALFLVPLLVALTSALALGVGLWLSALIVRFRDVRQMIGLFIQLWMFATPVVYPVTIVPEKYRWLVALNPMVGTIEGFRSALLGGPLDILAVTFSTVVAGLALVSGAFYFRRLERDFADMV